MSQKRLTLMILLLFFKEKCKIVQKVFLFTFDMQFSKKL